MGLGLIVSVGTAVLLSVAVLALERRRMGSYAAVQPSDEEVRADQKRRAKRVNERLKLASSFSNGLGIAFIATSVLNPLAAGRTMTRNEALLGLAVALILHLTGQTLLHFWKSEE